MIFLIPKSILMLSYRWWGQSRRETERERGRYREIEIDNGGVECTMKRNINFQAHINLSYKLLLKQSFFSSAHGAGFPMINNSCDNKVLV